MELVKETVDVDNNKTPKGTTIFPWKLEKNLPLLVGMQVTNPKSN